MEIVVGVGVAVGVGVGGGGRTAVGVGVVLMALSPGLAGVVPSGVPTSEPPQAAMPTRTRRARRRRGDFSITASPRLVHGVDGQDVEGNSFGACGDYRKGEVGWSTLGEDGSPHSRGHGGGWGRAVREPPLQGSDGRKRRHLLTRFFDSAALRSE